jgi:hypothetical protein
MMAVCHRYRPSLSRRAMIDASQSQRALSTRQSPAACTPQVIRVRHRDDSTAPVLHGGSRRGHPQPEGTHIGEAV